MRIANGMVGMRVTLTQEDYDLLTDSGKNKSVSVLFNGLSNPEDFLEISKKDLPGGVRLNIATGGQTTLKSGFPWVLTMTLKKFPKLSKVPHFGPEQVELVPHFDHSIPGWYVTRPTMSVAFQKKTRRTDPVTKQRLPDVSKPVPAPRLDTMSLRQAVMVVNEHKTEMGEDLILEIDKTTGRLKALIELGS